MDVVAYSDYYMGATKAYMGNGDGTFGSPEDVGNLGSTYCYAPVSAPVMFDDDDYEPNPGLDWWNFTMQVDNVAPSFNDTELEVDPGSTIDEHTEVTLSGLKFTDPAMEEETESFEYMIDWGDGTGTGWLNWTEAGPTKVGKVLFWEDLPVTNNLGYQDYQAAVQAYGATVTRVTTNPPLAAMQTYDVVFYYNGGIIGSSWPSMTDINLMKSYMDADGQMVWAGNFPTYYSASVGYASFLQTYFGVTNGGYHYIGSTPTHNMVGDNGDIGITGNWAVTNGHTEIYSDYNFHEVPNLVSGHSKEMHCANYASQTTMVSTDNSFKSVCWSFDLTLVSTTPLQAGLMEKVLDWFSGSGGGGSTPSGPEQMMGIGFLYPLQ